MTRALHIRAHGETSRDLGRSLCGRHAVWLAENGKHTCRTCSRVHGERAEFTREIAWEEVLLSLDMLLRWSRVERYPAITPELYRSMRCRTQDAITPAGYDEAARDGVAPSRYRVCRCEFCEIDARNASEVREMHESQQIRPHRKHAHPFGSYRAALTELLRPRAGVRSSAGSAAARAEETAKLGTHVQTTLRTDRDSLEIRRIDLAVDVRRCVERAFAEPQSRRGFSLRECVDMLLDTVRDEPRWDAIGEDRIALVRGVQRHGRKWAQIELAAADMTPEPRGARLCSEVERRRRERVA